MKMIPQIIHQTTLDIVPKCGPKTPEGWRDMAAWRLETSESRRGFCASSSVFGRITSRNCVKLISMRKYHYVSCSWRKSHRKWWPLRLATRARGQNCKPSTLRNAQGVPIKSKNTKRIKLNSIQENTTQTMVKTSQTREPEHKKYMGGARCVQPYAVQNSQINQCIWSKYIDLSERMLAKTSSRWPLS